MKPISDTNKLTVPKSGLSGPGIAGLMAWLLIAGFSLAVDCVFAATKPFDLELIAKDGDPATGTTGTLELDTEFSLAISGCGTAYFYAESTELHPISGPRKGIWEGSGSAVLDIAVDGQVLPGFMPMEEECIGVGPSCGEIFRTSPTFYVTALGEVLLRTSREDNLGSIAYLDGTARNNLAPILVDPGAAIPSRSFIALKTRVGDYLAGQYIGSKPFGEPDGGLEDFVTPLIGGPPPNIGDPVTVRDVYGTVLTGSGVSFGFNQNADRVFVIEMSDDGEAIYFQAATDPDSVLLARTGEVPPGIAIGAYLGFASFTSLGDTGKAQVNDSGQGFFVASWRNPGEPPSGLNPPRTAIWQFDATGTPMLVVSEYGNPVTDLAFPSSEFAATAFDDINQVQIAANGDIWFFAFGRRVAAGGFPDNSDERVGLWRRRADNGSLELVWRYTTSNVPGSRLPDGPNVPGTPLPDGTFFVGTGSGGYGLDEHSHVVFAGPEGLYAEDTSGMRLVVAKDQQIEIAPGEMRTVSSFRFNREGHVSGIMPSYRNDQLVFLVGFNDGSKAIYRTSRIVSFARPVVINSIGDAADENVADGFCDTGHQIGCQAECTLRAAIQQSNAKPGKKSIHFDILAKFARDVIYEIQLNSNLPVIDDPVVIDATTQAGYKPQAPVVELNAKPIRAVNPLLPSWGFDISAGDSTIRGFWINTVSKNGIRLKVGGGNVIQSNIIGTNIHKNTDVGTGEHGIWIVDSPGNTIGGTVARDRNVISGNGIAGTGGFGIVIEGVAASTNKVQGNYIGTNVAGDRRLQNIKGGVLLVNSPDNTIGGSVANSGNVISGNRLNGIQIEGAASRGNLVAGNIIGLDATGQKTLPNVLNGIQILEGSGAGNIIGGFTPKPGSGAGNTISGNLKNGIQITSPGQRVFGNIIGTNPGSLAGLGNMDNGVLIESMRNLVGTENVNSRNVISGNAQAGILVTTRGERTSIDANFIGTNITGTKALPNNNGIIIRDSALNKVGVNRGNVLSGNTTHGIFVTGGKSNSVRIENNHIGVDKLGFDVGVHNNVGNGGNGVRLMGVLNALVKANIISDNGATSKESGVLIHGKDESGRLSASQSSANNQLKNNIIGGDLDGAPAGNALDGVLVIDSSQNLIGPGNEIQSNGQNGINLIRPSLGEGNIITGNSIFINRNLGIDLGFDGVTANDPLDNDAGANGLQNFPVISKVSGSPLNLVRGSIRSRPNTSYTIEVFTNPAADSPSGHGEGEFFEGAFQVRTNASGIGTFSAGFGLGFSGDCVSATAQDNGTGDTSEFSLCVSIPPPVAAELDYGDAPDGPGQYPTLLLSNGARHQLGGGLFLGDGVDADPDGQPSADASGDNADGSDDEQGVLFTTPVIKGSSLARVEVTASAPGKLDAWIDFNRDGDWSDPSEQIFNNEGLLAGPNLLGFEVPGDAVPGATFARFRISTAGKLSPIGPAINGEVEDYRLFVKAPPPPPARPTGMTASDGTFEDRTQLNWNAVDGVSGYQVFRCTGTNSNTCGTAIGFSKSTGFDDRDGISGRKYLYRVKACLAGVCSTLSEADEGFRQPRPQDRTFSTIHRFVSFDGDGKDDVLLRHGMTGRWQIDFMSSRFVRPKSGLTPIFADLDWAMMGNGDFNGDGRGDVLLRNDVGGGWWMFQMNGRSKTDAAILMTRNPDWVMAAIDDFDKDGMDDVLLRHRVTGRWTINFMDAWTVRPNSGLTPMFTNLDWEMMGSGDFNGDGRGDVLLRNKNTGAWWIYLMDGRDNNGGGTSITLDLDWVIAAIDDFDGDGKDDVMLRHRLTGQWQINFMNWRLVRPNSGLTPMFVNLVWEMQGSGDFNGDGRGDVLLRNKVSNGWWMNLMNGRSSDSGGTPITRDKNWKVPHKTE